VRATLIAFVEAWLEKAEESVPIFAASSGIRTRGLHRAMERAETDPLRSQRRLADISPPSRRPARSRRRGSVMLARSLSVRPSIRSIRGCSSVRKLPLRTTFARGLVDTVLA